MAIKHYLNVLLLAAIGSGSLLSGCANAPAAANLTSTKPLFPDAAIKISEKTSIPLEKLVYWGGYTGLAYLILDPLTPNWDIEEAEFPDNRYHMTLKMKRIYAGGAGEAR